MKTKLTLLLAAFALSVPAFAGPSDAASFAVRHAQEAQKRQAASVGNSGPITYVASSSGKGGTIVSHSEQGSTNIALFKSKRNKSECQSCQIKKQ